jgi:Fe-S cluster assembly scaffold protein SufB
MTAVADSQLDSINNALELNRLIELQMEGAVG